MKKINSVLFKSFLALMMVFPVLSLKANQESTAPDNENLVSESMEWKYLDRDLNVAVRDSTIYNDPAENGKPTGEYEMTGDPNAYTWYSRWNKRNGWTYPDQFKDWGLFNMDFSHEEWSTNLDENNQVIGTSFTSNNDLYPGDIQLNKNDDGVRPAYFLRYTFTIDDPNEIYAIVGEVSYKDAMIFYINGKPVSSLFNIPMTNYRQNLEYGSNTSTDGIITEKFILEDTTSLMAGENVVAIELHASSKESDVYFKLNDFILNPDGENLPQSESVKSIAVNPGADDSQMNFAWYSLSNNPGYIEFMQADQVGDFDATKATKVEASSPQEVYTKFKSTTYYSNKVTITGLEPGKNYIYRVGNEDSYSDVYPLKVANTTNSQEIIFVSDPQIGTGTIPTDVHGWQLTLDNALTKYPNTSFIANTGDFVDVANKEVEYDAYFAPSWLKTYPTATAVGNHDTSANYGFHFNEPNLSDKGQTVANSDYYFIKGDVLYVVLNTSSKNNAEHITFMEDVIEQTKSEHIKWRVLLFHQSLYSGGKQATLEDNILRRNELVPTIDKLGFDIVLMGHDHGYVRTYQMLDFNPLSDEGTNPNGTLYITASSASGSKYYGSANLPEIDAYSAKSLFNVPTYTHIEFTDNELKLNTYQMYADGSSSLYDTYSIKKDLNKDAVNQLIETIKQTNFAKYSLEDYQAIISQVTQTSEKLKTTTRQQQIDDLHVKLKASFESLVKETMNASNEIKTNDDITIIGTHDQVVATSKELVDMKANADYQLLTKDQRFKGYSIIKGYDITLSRNNFEYQPDGKVIVKLPEPKELQGKTILIAHIHLGVIESITPVVKDGYYEFEVSAFSSFFILSKDSQNTNETPNNEKPITPENKLPETGQSTIGTILMGLGLAAIGSLVVIKKRKD